VAAYEFDVMVVGSGPGGATAAYHLARHGVNVGLVEKSSFPREKVCGDGLTPRAVKALHEMGVDTGDPGFVRVNGLRVYGRRARLDLPWPALSDWPGFGLVRTRHDYDQLLAAHAVKAGATLWERTEATAPVMDDGWVAGAAVRRLEEPESAPADGAPRAARREPPAREVRARFVIASDGASSRFAGHVGVRRDPARPLGIAARRYYRMTRPQVPMLEAWLDLWEGDSIMPGYGWIFPLHGDVVNVGAGLLNTFKGFKDISARRVFDIFVHMLPEEWGISEATATGSVKSGPLPMGFNRRPLSQPGMLVIGDAGGLVNPFNGEGISYAMETGKLAAELVYEALAMGKPGLAHVYPTLVRERYGKYFFMGNTFVKLIGDPRIMRFATDHGLHREWIMRFAMRVLANLSDGPKGDVRDRLFYAMERLAPAA
jgi:geranylgeranyl reductase family protein